MAELDIESREQKAYRRVLAAVRAIAKQRGTGELAEAVTSATHRDVDVRDMRRMEALAPFLEEIAGEKEDAKPSKAKAKAENEAAE